jgi:hypothetical protein
VVLPTFRIPVLLPGARIPETDKVPVVVPDPFRVPPLATTRAEVLSASSEFKVSVAPLATATVPPTISELAPIELFADKVAVLPLATDRRPPVAVIDSTVSLPPKTKLPPVMETEALFAMTLSVVVWIVPSDTDAVPEKVFAPDRVRVPDPLLEMLPPSPSPLTTPDRVKFPEPPKAAVLALR